MQTNFFRYTLIFITRKNDVLMLHRRNPPNQGLWNGVGGHLEPGESPLVGALREVHEETGYKFPTAHFAGVLTWEGHTETPGGLYIFLVEAPGDLEPQYAKKEEGELAWKPREWVLNSTDVVNNIHHFGPLIFSKKASHFQENDKVYRGIEALPPSIITDYSPSANGGIEALPDFHFIYAPGDKIVSWEIRKYLPDIR